MSRTNRMGLAFLLLSSLFSGGGFLFLHPNQAEPIYMMSLVFSAMALLCFFGRPRSTF